MFNKIITLSDRFPTGEPTLMAVVQRGHRGGLFEKNALAKTASPALDYITNVQPREGKTVVLVNAMGAFEVYDDNRNGDGFPEEPYRVGEVTRCGHPRCNPDKRGWINPDEVLPLHYSTFEKYGKVFQNHINKDPGRSLGSILKAFYNTRMHRVELLLELDNLKAKEHIQRINDGEYPAVSMGCRVQWDVCAFCGHRAPTRKDYCEHLLLEMRQIDPSSGVRKCALNPSPHLFDISLVVRPADETGYMLKKVAEDIYALSSAELGEKVASFEQKQAKVRKLSEIQKIIAGNVQAARPIPEYTLLKKYREEALTGSPETPPMGEDEKAAFLSFPLVEVLSSLAFKGAALSIAEFAQLLMEKKASYNEDILDRITAIQPLVNEVLSVRPDIIEKFAFQLLDSEKINPLILSKCALWIEKRAGILDWARQKVHDIGMPVIGRGATFGPAAAYSMREPARSDVFTMTDPNTGAMYRTNRAAMMAGEDTNYRSLLGDTALYGTTYTALMHLLPGVRHLPLHAKALLALPAGYLTAQKARQIFHPYGGIHYMTDQGLVAPANVEFVKTSTLLNKLAHDYTDRLGYWPQGRLDAALLYKIARRDPLSELPEILFDEQRIQEKVAEILHYCEMSPTDATSPPDINFSRLGSAIGALALR